MMSKKISIGGVEYGDGRVVLAKAAVVTGDDGNDFLVVESDSPINEALKKRFGGAVKVAEAGALESMTHTPAYELCLVPSDEFGIKKSLAKVTDDFEFEVGDAGSGVTVRYDGGSWAIGGVYFLRTHPELDEYAQGGPTVGRVLFDDYGYAGSSNWVARVHTESVRAGAPRRPEVPSWMVSSYEGDIESLVISGDTVAKDRWFSWSVLSRVEIGKASGYVLWTTWGNMAVLKAPADDRITSVFLNSWDYEWLPDSSFLYVKEVEVGTSAPSKVRLFPYRSEAGEVDMPALRRAIAAIEVEAIIASEEKAELLAEARRIMEVEEASQSDEMTWLVMSWPELPSVAEDSPDDEDANSDAEPSNDGTEARDTVYFDIAKRDEEKRIVFGPILIPEHVDLQDDVMSEEEIEKAAHNFLAKYNVEKKAAHMHEDFDVSHEVVESYVAPVDFEMNGRKIVKGTWLMAMRILDNDIWEQVKSGEIRGFSPGGTGRKTEEQDA